MSLKGRLYDLVLGPLERAGLAGRRGALLDGLQGRVLEIGTGTGLNLPHYPDGVDLIAIEPQREMLERAVRRRRQGQRLVRAGAEGLPFPDDAFDAVVGTFVFCTVDDPAAGLREAHRVLRPEGELRLIEHVRWDRHPRLARAQDWATPIWRVVADGCRLNRPTGSLIESAGFEIGSRREDADGLLLEARARPSLEAT